MLLKNFSITNQNDEIIRGDIRYRVDVRKAPTVIICHGFKGFKDWGFFPHLSSSLASAGYAAVTFNFSRNGIGTDLENFTELERFANNTYSHELNDLKCVVDAVCNQQISKGIIDCEKIGLMGHSRGGGIAILYASTDDRIQTVVTWSAISKVNRYDEQTIKEWKSKGYIEIENKRTKQVMKLNVSLLKDIENNKKKLDILNAASNLEIPAMIIHGNNDESVPVEEAKIIFEKMKQFGRDLAIIEGGTHTFGISHPMVANTEQYEEVLDITEHWFDNNLNY